VPGDKVVLSIRHLRKAPNVTTLLAPVFPSKTSNHKRKDDGITGCRFNATGLQPDLPAGRQGTERKHPPQMAQICSPANVRWRICAK